MLVIQNDYFLGGKYPLWNAEATLVNIVQAIAAATGTDVPDLLSKGPVWRR